MELTTKQLSVCALLLSSVLVVLLLTVESSLSQSIMVIAQAYQTEISFWESVKDSRDADELEAYLQAYPKGKFAPLAKIRLKKLKTYQVNPVASPVVKKTEPRSPNDAQMPELLKDDKGFVGISVRDLSDKEADKFGSVASRGTWVSGINDFGPAKSVDLLKNDIIVKIGSQSFRGTRDFVERIQKIKPGSPVSLSILRDGKNLEITFAAGALARDYYTAAQNGSKVAISKVASYLDQGFIFKKNQQEALRWYKLASKSGNKAATVIVAVSYEFAMRGTTKDLQQAALWYQKAVDLGDRDSLFHLGRLHDFVKGFPHDDKIAAEYYKKAAAQKHTGAITNLAVMYHDGRGVRKDYKEYIRLLRQAAKLGQAQAHLNLGYAYARGKGVKANTGQAFEHWNKGASMGHSAGWRFIANTYWDGEGVKKNKTKAIKFYRQAAAKNDKQSIDILNKNGISPHDPAIVQSLLAQLGYDPGPIDGKPGSKTRHSIMSFQREQGLQKTGKLSFDLQKKLATALTKKRSRPKPKRANELDELERLD
ncbi:MAG: PDZ domain-containing protein [bacterium]|nr:PDZ domain-containing protein [bacterium]